MALAAEIGVVRGEWACYRARWLRDSLAISVAKFGDHHIAVMLLRGGDWEGGKKNVLCTKVWFYQTYFEPQGIIGSRQPSQMGDGCLSGVV